MKMTALKLGFLLLGLAVTSAAAGSGSCVGRCGEVFTRGQQCTCDFSCLQHNECCPDFKATCTASQSCQGRCGETYKRGQLCECDPLCIRFNTCCHDYQQHCDATMTLSHRGSSQSRMATVSRNQKKRKSEKSRKRSNSESEELYAERGYCPQCQGTPGLHDPLTDSVSSSAHPAVLADKLLHGGSNIPAGRLAVPAPSSSDGALHFPSPDPSLPSHSALTMGRSVPVNPSTPGGKLNVQLMLSPEGVNPFGPSLDVSGQAGSRPNTLDDVRQALGLSGGEEGSQGSGTGFLADLCGDSPINGLTALSNGTVLVFKGELFWSVDPVSPSVGRPQNITEMFGIPFPIDTIFTRSDCNRNTYIIKGDMVWRLDSSMMMEPGYPKPLTSEFPGLAGRISAALTVPATRSTLEAVFFFKNGDIMQKFTFPPGSTPSCTEKPRGSLKTQLDRLTDVVLSGEINIKVSLKGFPTPITSALSMPSPQGSDGYLHFVFSGPLIFRVQISGDLPALAKPDPSTALIPLFSHSPAAMATSSASTAGQSPDSHHPANSIRFWLGCP